MAPRPAAWLLGLALVACLAGATPDEETSHLLDGMAFVGLNGEKGRPLDPDEHEEMVFEDGRFRSLSCEPYNFGDSAYTATRVGDAIHFRAETGSPTHGRIAWQGVVEGDKARATFVWTKQRWYWDIHREYWFEGRRRR